MKTLAPKVNWKEHFKEELTIWCSASIQRLEFMQCICEPGCTERLFSSEGIHVQNSYNLRRKSISRERLSNLFWHVWNFSVDSGKEWNSVA